MARDKVSEDLKLPVLSLKGAVLFPGISLPIVVTHEDTIEAIDAALSRPEKIMIVSALKVESEEKTEIAKHDMYNIGTKAVVSRMSRGENAVRVILNGYERVRIDQYLREKEHFVAMYHNIGTPDDTSAEIEALHRETLRMFSELQRNTTNEWGIPISNLIENVKDSCHQTYLMAVILGLGVEKEQALLEASTRYEACQLMHDFVSYEHKVQKIREKISRQVASELGKEQREYFLRRQLDEIHKELGEGKDTGDIENLDKQIASANLPEVALKEAKKQLIRLNQLNEASPEYQVAHSYLRYIVDLPWNKRTEDMMDLERAEQILDEDHYNLNDVKERIIEQLAVRKLNPKAKAPILSFVGPPGVGKTSLGQSIARALGRQFERMSLGGVHDEAELRGHRRTYIGAMPGRILEAIRRAGVINPLIMLDEVDKLGVDFRGDPAAALMEVLDPAQNYEFHDNYLDLPFDLSQVFFITTANTTENIPKPLLDRMETLRLAGYTDYDKVEIAKRYLIPLEVEQSGITLSHFKISDRLLLEIIHNYTREAGVRQLQRCIGKIARKIAVRLARGDRSEVHLTSANLQEYLGPKKVFLEQVRKKWGVGVSTGLAWTDSGGDIIYIETSLLRNRKDDIRMTGHLGEVMRESVNCAISYIWAQDWLGAQVVKHSGSGLHIHVPAGAIPKDGPSAGLAIAVALASLYSNKPVRQDVAMTGEITLSGLVLPVGGIKEKALAAHRAGIKRVILPAGNKKDLVDIPDSVCSEIEFIFVEEIDQALSAAIPGSSHRQTVWTKGAQGSYSSVVF